MITVNVFIRFAVAVLFAVRSFPVDPFADGHTDGWKFTNSYH